MEIREIMGVTLAQLIEASPAEISKIGAPGFNDFISVQLLEGFLFQNGMPCRNLEYLVQSFRMQHTDNHKTAHAKRLGCLSKIMSENV